MQNCQQPNCQYREIIFHNLSASDSIFLTIASLEYVGKMKPKAQVWLVLDASASTSSINEHCHVFFAHSRLFRAHLEITGAKTVLAQRW